MDNYQKTMQHLAKMDTSILSRNPELLKTRLDWPSDKDMQLAFTLAKLGYPPYSDEANKFISQIVSL